MTLKPPRLEEQLGLRQYLTDTLPVGGCIKNTPADFLVQEVSTDGRLCLIEGDSGFQDVGGSYAHFTLVKENWTGFRAIRELANRLHMSHRRFGFAGTKDKKAVTAQRVSVKDAGSEDLAALSVRDIRLKDFTRCPNPLSLGDLWGNRFTITVRGIAGEREEVESTVSEAIESLSSGFPNFFGLQRFGVQRPITHLVGRHILRGDFEAAVNEYLFGSWDNPYESLESRVFRENLAETLDYKGALRGAPRHMGHEKALLNHLASCPGDFEGALKSLPPTLQSMFIHAYQGYVFNNALSGFMENDYHAEALPLVGYSSEPDAFSKRVLEEDGISAADFKNRDRNMDSRGGVRDAYCHAQDPQASINEDDSDDCFLKAVFSFSLPAGSYATMYLREFMKNKYWETKQLNQP